MNTLIPSKKDLNNNSAKSNGTDEMNDDDDVHTVETAETETLLPEDKLGMNGDADDEEEQHPEDPDDSDIVSAINISHN